MLLKVPDFGRLSWPFLAPFQCSRHLKEKILWYSDACGVAVCSLAVVQCTSMVALAPNSSETSPWDILDTFPKLHSRAREANTRSCTEAPHSKSRNGIEIWLLIYESCDGLESFTRDPIGYRGSEWNLYEYVDGGPLQRVDPLGLEGYLKPCEPRSLCEYTEGQVVMSACDLVCLLDGNSPWRNNPGPAIYQEAIEWANSIDPPTANNPNPIGNQALRHCYSSARMACEFGRNCARCGMNKREEYQTLCANQPINARDRAIANNNIGIDVGGTTCDPEKQKQSCLDKWQGGRLDTRPD